MESREQVFRIRCYGFAQLALFYCPELSKKSASTRLSHWLSISEQLQSKLKEAGFRKGSKLLTPKQVWLIVEHLGEPEM